MRKVEKPLPEHPCLEGGEVELRQETATGTSERENSSFLNPNENSKDLGAQASVGTGGSYAQQPAKAH